MICHNCSYDGYYTKYPAPFCSRKHLSQFENTTIDLPEEIIDQFNAKLVIHKAVSFLTLCVEGKEEPDKIDDYVEQWHQSDSPYEIYVFLGMNLCQYSDWVTQKRTIQQIVEDQKEYLRIWGQGSKIMDSR